MRHIPGLTVFALAIANRRAADRWRTQCAEVRKLIELTLAAPRPRAARHSPPAPPRGASLPGSR